MNFDETVRSQMNQRLFRIISGIGAELGFKVYVVGGWVRDLVLNRVSKDVDIVVVGDGIKLASAVNASLKTGKTLKIFKNFGTAMLQYRGWDVEFVGARKESYLPDSRKPDVESGSLVDDLNRRDFTINTLAISLNEEDYGSLVDQFQGQDDIIKRSIKTPLDPDITFSDDPLRMMRAVRFASQLDFIIEESSFRAIKRNAHRLKIVSVERIMDEFNKIMITKNPGQGITLLRTAGLLEVFFPELDALGGIEVIKGKAHKDNFIHTMKVLDKLSVNTSDLWLRWAALLHDIAKPYTKKFEPGIGWTFHGHDYLGHKMVEAIFRRLKLPMNDKMKYVKKLVLLHLRPIALTESIVTDSAVRRLLFDAGNDIDDLMLLCEADITSGNSARVKLYMKNFEMVREKLREIEEKDRLRNWQPPVSGEDIMKCFDLKPCREVGIIKIAIREAILEGKIPNERKAALNMMEEEGKKIGLHPIKKIN
jgi:poly(A) polymerase